MRNAVSLATLVFSFSFAPSALASTSGNFESDQLGRVTLDNRHTRDADFLWDLLRADPSEAGEDREKNFGLSSGQVVGRCRRSKINFRDTSCSILYSKQPGNTVEIVIEKNSGMIGATLGYERSNELRGQFLPLGGTLASPDRRMIFCGYCGIGDSRLWLIWRRETREFLSR